MMRKTRRTAFGKKLMMIALALILIIICVLIVPFSHIRVAAGEKMGISVKYETYVVQSGDTLWDIADTHMDGSYDNHQDYIDEVMRANGLKSCHIYDGQLIIIPCTVDACEASVATE